MSSEKENKNELKDKTVDKASNLAGLHDGGRIERPVVEISHLATRSSQSSSGCHH